MTSRARALALGAASIGALVVSGAMAACSSSDNGFGTNPAGSLGAKDGGAVINTAADGSVLSADGATTVVTSRIRFAHLASELGGVDFCFRTSAADPFHGPILQTGSQTIDFDGGAGGDDASSGGSGDDASELDAAAVDAAPADAALDADAGATSGDASTNEQVDSGALDYDAGLPPLTYLTVSDDVSIAAAGAIDVIAVEPGSGCVTPLVLSQITLDPTLRTTLLLAGGAQADASGALGISAYADEVAAADPSQASVRVVNAALSPFAGPLAVSFESNGADTPLATDVEPRSVASASRTAPIVDGHGYTSVASLTSGPGFRIIETMDNSTAVTSAIAAAPSAGSVHTAFVTEDVSGAFVVLWCDDLLSPSCEVVR